MRRLGLAFACLFLLLARPDRAWSDQATDLLFFSGDLATARNIGGVGWLHASSGLDFSGPVFSAQLGRPEFGLEEAEAAVGWRIWRPGLWVTLQAGLEVDPIYAPAVRPLASGDVWWEPLPDLAAAASVQATPDYVSWRLALGARPAADWPWIGPEAGSSAGDPRVGAHATGLRLPDGLEARISLGASWRSGKPGPYADLSVWRRF